uniref:DUF4143 domain-containing protein n=1 Tax=Mesocestoides corti TaxID=53468 RepID=A0A5K3F8L1_MESCO
MKASVFNFSHLYYLGNLKQVFNLPFFTDERSSSLDFETQREVDTILASNISVTQFLEALIAEPQMRHLWVRVKVCGTVGGELSGCRLDFS